MGIMAILAGFFILLNAISTPSTSQPTPSSSPNYSNPPPEPTTEKIIPNLIAESSSNEIISRSYSWSYRGNWSWKFDIPRSLYDYYKKLPRPPTANYSIYVTHPLDDEYINQLISKLRSTARDAKFNEYQTVEFAAAFIQSLPYTSDSVTTGYDEYPRYPIETLVDNGGDCEDTSILLASILKGMGYDAVLIEPPKHMAVGVASMDSVFGTYWNYNGRKYYYVETTGKNWKIGELPDEYKNESAHIYELIPVPILTHDWKTATVNVQGGVATLPITIAVDNIGTASASGVFVYAGFDAGGNQMWNPETSQTFTLAPGQSTIVNLNLRIPRDTYTRLEVQISYGGYAVDESYSKWIQTP